MFNTYFLNLKFLFIIYNYSKLKYFKMSKEYVKGMGRVEIPLALKEPEYDFKLGKKRRKIPNPLVELMYPPPKQGLLNKYSLKQLKDAITEMNELGLTNVQGFSQISRPELVRLILNNSKYFGIPAVKIIGKERTYFNWEDKKDDKRFSKWSDYFDVEEDVKKSEDIKKKRETRKLQKEQGIPDIGIYDKLFALSKEEQKRKEIDERLKVELEKLKKDVNNKSLQNKILKEEEKRKEIDDKLKVELEKLKKEVEGVKRQNLDENLLKEFEKLKESIKGKKGDIISQNLKGKLEKQKEKVSSFSEKKENVSKILEDLKKKGVDKEKIKAFLKEFSSIRGDSSSIKNSVKKMFDNLTKEEQKEVENDKFFKRDLGNISKNYFSGNKNNIQYYEKKIDELDRKIKGKNEAIEYNKSFKTKKALEKGKVQNIKIEEDIKELKGEISDFEEKIKKKKEENKYIEENQGDFNKLFEVLKFKII